MYLSVPPVSQYLPANITPSAETNFQLETDVLKPCLLVFRKEGGLVEYTKKNPSIYDVFDFIVMSDGKFRALAVSVSNMPEELKGLLTFLDEYDYVYSYTDKIIIMMISFSNVCAPGETQRALLPRVPVQKKTVLIVGSDKITNRLIRANLEEAGYHVEEAEGIQSALGEMGKDIDLIVFDYDTRTRTKEEDEGFFFQRGERKQIPVITIKNVLSPFDGLTETTRLNTIEMKIDYFNKLVERTKTILGD